MPGLVRVADSAAKGLLAVRCRCFVIIARLLHATRTHVGHAHSLHSGSGQELC